MAMPAEVRIVGTSLFRMTSTYLEVHGVPAAAPVHGAGHPDAARQALAPALCVDILKRRGPPLDAPLQLPAQAPRLRALLAASAPAGAAGPGGGKVRSLDTKKEESHALDRLAVAA